MRARARARWHRRGRRSRSGRGGDGRDPIRPRSHGPGLARAYINLLVKQLENEDTNLAVKRNVVRLFQFIEIPKRYSGRIFDACYKFVDDPKETVAVRVFAMTVAAKIAKDSPELLDELRLVATKYPQAATAGFCSRARRILGV